MGLTKRKLDEARFFLHEMESSCYHSDRTFEYHLSAFISAARSVLWVMKHEHADLKDWKAWYDANRPGSEEEAMLKGLNQLRVRAVKQGTPEVQYLFEIQIPKTHMTSELKTFLAQLHPGKNLEVTLKPGIVKNKATITGKRASFSCRPESLFPVVSEFPDANVVTICKRYVSWLSSLVCECEKRFASLVN